MKTKNKDHIFSARISSEIHERLKVYADRTGRKYGHIIGEAIKEYLIREDKRDHRNKGE